MIENRQNNLETISAYLDNALEDAERSRFEDRLRREPALRAELESLQRTRDLLRSAPHYAAPRNFTLSPEMVGVRASRPGPLFGLARLTFALTTILFAVALVGSFTFQTGFLSRPAAETAFEVESADQADPAAAVPAPTEAIGENEEPVVEMEALEQAEEAPAEESAAGEPETGDSAAGETSVQEDAESVEEPSGGGGPVPGAENPDAPESFAPPTDISESMEAEDQGDPASADEDENQRVVDEGAVDATASPLANIPADSPQGKAPNPQAPPSDSSRTHQINYWSIFVFLTAAAALLSGALTWHLRRR